MPFHLPPVAKNRTDSHTSFSGVLRLSLALISPLAYHTYALAQTTPDAGSIQRDLEQRNPDVVPPKADVPLPAPPRQDPSTVEGQGGPSVMVKQYAFEGNTLVSSADLTQLLSDATGKALSFKDIDSQRDRIASLYAERGWFARVMLPEQDVTDGTIRIRILESRLDEVTMDNRSTRVSGEFVRRLVQGSMQPGQPLSDRDIARGLLLANDLPGIQTTGEVDAGREPGKTRLLLRTEDRMKKSGDSEKPETYTGYVNLTNYGGKSTGVPQLSAGISPNNLLGRGDRLDINSLVSQGTQLAALGYVVPVGSSGTKLNVRGSYLRYKLIDEDSKRNDARGRASSFGMGLSYPVVRQRAYNFAMTGNVETRGSVDQKKGIDDAKKRINAASVGGVGDWLDDVGGGGFNQYAFNLVGGHVSNGIDDKKGYALSGLPANRRYGKLSFVYSRLQRLDAGLGLFFSLSGQVSNKRLDSSERFGLSGPTGVRAYNGDGTGDSGALMTVELRKEIVDGVQGVVFVDAGKVKLNDRGAIAFSNKTIPVTWDKTLKGAGVGINWNYDNKFQVRAAVAKPIGNNPYADANGNNADGSKKGRVRGWIQATYLF